jgi:hypothetical protein
MPQRILRIISFGDPKYPKKIKKPFPFAGLYEIGKEKSRSYFRKSAERFLLTYLPSLMDCIEVSNGLLETLRPDEEIKDGDGQYPASASMEAPSVFPFPDFGRILFLKNDFKCYKRTGRFKWASSNLMAQVTFPWRL